ncbi:MAG: SH3 domain-containing protein [Anaerolineaceae bacterium]|jgi:hypothetical protein
MKRKYFLLTTVIVFLSSACFLTPKVNQSPLSVSLTATAVGQSPTELVKATEVATQPPVTEVSEPTVTPIKKSPLDLSSASGIVRGLNEALTSRDLSSIEEMMRGDQFYYSYYIEGLQIITRDQFLVELEDRIDSNPQCLGYTSNETFLFVWYTGWYPNWRMTEMCYAGCEPISPPWESSTAAFVFFKEDGNFYMDTLFQNEFNKNWFFDLPPLTPCNQEEPTPLPTVSQPCQNGLAQRLQVNGWGIVCTKSDPVVLRGEPGKSGKYLGDVQTGTIVKILEGPKCASNMSWWQVQLQDGKKGWISEGGDKTDPYFLCPHQ